MTYSYLVTNNGNVTLNPVVVTDPMPGLSAITCPTTVLAPTSTEDLHRHLHHHPGRPRRRPSTTPAPPPARRRADRMSRATVDPVSIPAVQTPGITLHKTARRRSSFTAAGTLVTYSYLVTNTGNVTLNPVTVTDPMPGLVGHHLPGHRRWPRAAPRPAPPPTPPPRPTSTAAHQQHRHGHRHPAERAQRDRQSSVTIPAVQTPASPWPSRPARPASPPPAPS